MPDITSTADHERKSVAFKLDDITDAGEFTGYAAVFGSVDNGGDVIKKGAFARTLSSWRKSKRPIPVLYQHAGSDIVGTTLEAREDDRGLFVRGKLLVDDVPEARKTRALLKAGVLSGMSIGYSTVRESFEQAPKSTIRHLEEVRLYEYSFVTWPMHDEARVMSVKGSTTPTDSSDSERLARLEEEVASIKALLPAPPQLDAAAPAEGSAADPPAEHSAVDDIGPDPGHTSPVVEALGDEPSRFLAEIRSLIRR